MAEVMLAGKWSTVSTKRTLGAQFLVLTWFTNIILGFGDSLNVQPNKYLIPLMSSMLADHQVFQVLRIV